MNDGSSANVSFLLEFLPEIMRFINFFAQLAPSGKLGWNRTQELNVYFAAPFPPPSMDDIFLIPVKGAMFIISYQLI